MMSDITMLEKIGLAQNFNRNTKDILLKKKIITLFMILCLLSARNKENWIIKLGSASRVSNSIQRFYGQYMAQSYS